MDMLLWVFLGLVIVVVAAVLMKGRRREFENLADVPDDDPALLAAEAEARDRWPGFVQAFADRADGEVFSVKIKVAEGGRTEHMWMTVAQITDDAVVGTLGNDPVTVTSVKIGDQLTRTPAEIEDWLILCADGTMKGGYTVKVLMSQGRV